MNRNKEWKDLHEARRIMKGIKMELKQLDRLMVLAQQEVCQPKYA
jgi:hypothetical protein